MVAAAIRQFQFQFLTQKKKFQISYDFQLKQKIIYI